MPGIDFAVLRAQVSIFDVLYLLDFRPVSRRGDYVRGVCPFECSTDPRRFVANVVTNKFYCHCCKRGGNQLELWSLARSMRFFDGAKDLCLRLNIPIPYLPTARRPS